MLRQGPGNSRTDAATEHAIERGYPSDLKFVVKWKIFFNSARSASDRSQT